MDFVTKEPINKGWSNDKKYCVTDENGQAFIDYINENRYWLKDRPQVYQHGNYHIGNMMIGRDRKLYIKKYGTVFKIYDDQVFGNICFGTEKDGQRYYVKFAGSPTEQYSGDPSDAIARLKSTLPIYSELKHENLIDFIEAKKIDGGFAMVFKWADGDCMGRIYPAAHRHFIQLSFNDDFTCQNVSSPVRERTYGSSIPAVWFFLSDRGGGTQGYFALPYPPAPSEVRYGRCTPL